MVRYSDLKWQKAAAAVAEKMVQEKREGRACCLPGDRAKFPLGMLTLGPTIWMKVLRSAVAEFRTLWLDEKEWIRGDQERGGGEKGQFLFFYLGEKPVPLSELDHGDPALIRKNRERTTEYTKWRMMLIRKGAIYYRPDSGWCGRRE